MENTDTRNLTPEIYNGFSIYTQKVVRSYGRMKEQRYRVKIVNSNKKILHDIIADINFGVHYDDDKEDVISAAKKYIDTHFSDYNPDSMAIRVGDIFYTSWGYDQTNYDFLVVTGVSPSGKTVEARMLAVDSSESGFMAEDVKPTTRFQSKPFKMVVKANGGDVLLRGSYPFIGGNDDSKRMGTFWRHKGDRSYRATHYA